MAWEFNSKSSIFIQIVDRIKADIVSGKYPPGSQIPPVRTLAAEAAVNPNTMQRALSELEALGFLVTKGTTGRFVTSDETLLNRTNRRAKDEAMENIIRQAEAMGISDDEIIAYITERKAKKEAARNG